jgi:antitoxin HicB
MLIYPARLIKDGTGYIVSFRDVPEALTFGKSKREALNLASDALATAMEFYFECRRQVPTPTEIEKNEEPVALSASMTAKVLLLNEMLSAKITPAALAKKLDISPQTMTRIIDLRHSTKIDTIADALFALGKRIKITAE